MKSARAAEQEKQTHVETRRNASRRRVAVVVVFATFAIALFEYSRAATFNDDANIEATRAVLKPLTELSSGDYSRFDHASPKEHADLMAKGKCGSCHRRSDASLGPRFPMHKDCTGCHMVQFTAANNSASVNPICTICHKTEGLNSPTAPLKAFSRLVSFTAEFDHAQHLQGIADARPARGCMACHGPANRGVAESVPARLNAHRGCYECHSPGKQASKTSSCGSCHAFGRHSSISITARSYRLGFSHADHGSRARLTCDRCHEIRGRGLPPTRQVSSIAAVQHLPNARGCITCHNGMRSFGEQVKGNFDNCRRCHKGLKFGS